MAPSAHGNPLRQAHTTEEASNWKEFDKLGHREKQEGLALLINLIPPVKMMRDWLLGLDIKDDDVSSHSRKLSDIKDGQIHASVWLVLRWIIGSNTSYIREIEDQDMLVRNVPKDYRQFMFISGQRPQLLYRLKLKSAFEQVTRKRSVCWPMKWLSCRRQIRMLSSTRHFSLSSFASVLELPGGRYSF